MLNLVLKQLQLNLPKTLLTVLALTTAIAVILILEGFEQGQYHQLRQIVLDRQADLILSQNGVKNFIATRSVIPQTARAEVEAIPGVMEAYPITSLPIIYYKNNIRTPVYIIVHDNFGGPVKLLNGTSKISGKNIVIDKSLAKKYELAVGDKFAISEFEFTISGITNSAAFMMPFAFINYDGMIDLFLESDIAADLSTFPLLSYMLVKTVQGYDNEQIAKSIEEKVNSVDVHQLHEIARNDVNLGKTFFGPIMGVLVVVAYMIGLLVVSLIIYSDTSNNLKNYAILKALGFPVSSLTKYLLFMSLILLLIAIPSSILLALFITTLIELISPIYEFRLFELTILYQTLGACLIFAILGGLIPAQSINRIDPVIALQSA